MLEISIPCATCATALRFGERWCSSCGAEVPARTRTALENRLESASPEFRALKHRGREAPTILVALAAAYLAFGLLFYFVLTDGMPGTSGEGGPARTDFIGALIISGAMLACHAWARRAPVLAIATALVVWIAVEIATVRLDDATIVGIGAKLVTLSLLIRGLASAIIAARLHRKLVARRPAPLPTARLL